MKIAVHYGATDQGADPGQVAYEAEIRGFEGIFFPEHTHMPVDHSAAPYSGTDDRMVQYRRLYSPFIAMAWAASRTSRLSIGTCVSLPGQHDPIILAKTLGSLDKMSHGRITYGFGFGWLEQEMIDHGVDPGRRRATVREKMMAVKTIWTQEEASFAGEYVRFPPCWSWPKPDAASVPILLGAKGTDQVFDHVIEYCEGWMPPVREIEGFPESAGRLRSRAAEAGRDPDTVQIDVIAPRPSLALLEGFEGLGVRRAILHLPFGDIGGITRKLDEYRRDYVRYVSV